jgi:hypothetical protein
MSELGERVPSHHIHSITGAQLLIQTVQWLLKNTIILCLGLLLAIGLLLLAQGTFQVLAYYWLSKTPQLYPINLETLFWGIKLIALFLVSIWLLSQYRANYTCKAIVKRSVITGAVLGVLIIGMVALERFVINYYTHKILCELSVPTSSPHCK